MCKICEARKDLHLAIYQEDIAEGKFQHEVRYGFSMLDEYIAGSRMTDAHSETERAKEKLNELLKSPVSENRRCRLLGLPKRFVLFDLECTTWEGAAARAWSGIGEHREVVQIAAALVEAKNFTTLATFQALVKPKINPILSPYFIDLTHITQERVDEQGFDFADVLSDFYAWCEDHELYCFDSRVDGSRLFDRDVLIENCDLRGLEFPFNPDKFHNINEIFFKHGYVVKQSGASPEVFGRKIPARPHDAMNDVNGVLVSLRALSERV